MGSYSFSINFSPTCIQMNVNFASFTGKKVNFDLGPFRIPEKGGNMKVGGLEGVPVAKFPKPPRHLSKNVG